MMKTTVTGNEARISACYRIPLSFFSVGTEGVITPAPLTIVQGERKIGLDSD